MNKRLIINISELVTFEGAKALSGEAMSRPKKLHDAWILIEGEKILSIGTGEPPKAEAAHILDASGKLALPGVVDSHTHFVFAGHRQAEYNLRLQGTSYAEIMAAGGGIVSTVASTREASKDELIALGRSRLDHFLSLGVTTVEGKSGYGLDEETELRQLEVMHLLDQEHPVDVIPTYMGAHAVPKQASEEAFIDFQIETMLPLVMDQGIARFVDIFTEKGVFELFHSHRYLTKARDLGFSLKVHADEMVPLGGAQLAAEMGAVSAEHLLHISEEGIEALEKSGTIAVLLPLTAFSLKEEYAPAREMIERGVPVALATDFNPGSCPSMSVPLLIALATHNMGMNMEETICALTINGAAALCLADSRGTLEPGKLADIVLHDVESLDHLSYHFGVNTVDTVVRKGKMVYEKRRSFVR